MLSKPKRTKKWSKRAICPLKTDIFRVLQVLDGALSPIFEFFDLLDALNIRGVCSALRVTVIQFHWLDVGTGRS